MTIYIKAVSYARLYEKPKYLKTLIFDFYALAHLSGVNRLDFNEQLFSDVITYNFKVVKEYLAEALSFSLIKNILREIQEGLINNPINISEFVNDINSIPIQSKYSYQKLVETIVKKYGIKNIFNYSIDLFDEGKWLNNFGGKRWENIAKLGRFLLKPSIKIEYIDNVINAMHNTNTLIGKLFSNEKYQVTEAELNLKSDFIKNWKLIIDLCSDVVKRHIRHVFRHDPKDKETIFSLIFKVSKMYGIREKILERKLNSIIELKYNKGLKLRVLQVLNNSSALIPFSWNYIPYLEQLINAMTRYDGSSIEELRSKALESQVLLLKNGKICDLTSTDIRIDYLLMLDDSCLSIRKTLRILNPELMFNFAILDLKNNLIGFCESIKKFKPNMQFGNIRKMKNILNLK
jgi:hypothetical protein